MADNELLLAISNLIEPLREDIQGLKTDVQGLKAEMQEVKADVQGLKAEMQEVKADMQGLKADVQRLDTDMQEVKVRVKKIELTQENEVLPRLNTIESCYTSTYDRYKDSVEEHESMKQDIDILKKVVTEHSEKLQRIS